MLIKETKKEPFGLQKLRAIFGRKFIAAVLILLLLLGLGFYMVSRRYHSVIIEQGYHGSFDFIRTVAGNYIKGLRSETPDLIIDLKHKHFQVLAWKRELALQRGHIVNEEDSWVPALMTFDGRQYEIDMRLKGHMTDHVEGDKWSFRIKFDGPGDIMGMRRFSLQHPGTRGYINEWIYHELQRREGIIALRYEFLDLTLNGKDLGIYALEENFDEELVSGNNRPEGPLMRFDPSLYWVYRLREIQEFYLHNEYGSFSSTVIQPYREKATFTDPTMRAKFLEAHSLMEAFLRQELSAEQVFDLDLMASFHAIIDLVGGQFSLDWSDVKFYYNSLTRRLEPVSYESTGANPIRHLSASNKFNNSSEGRTLPYHTLLFSDSLFLVKYFKAVERISDPLYLDRFFEEVADELDQNLKSQYREFPYKKFRKDLFYKNQESMRMLLSPPAALRAFAKVDSLGGLQIEAASITHLPIHLTDLRIGKTNYTISSSLIPPKPQGTEMKFQQYSFTHIQTDPSKDTLYLFYKLPGVDLKDSVTVYPYAYSQPVPLAHSSWDLSDIPFIAIDTSVSEIRFLSGNWTIEKNITIPTGYTVVIGPKTQLTFRNSSLTTYSPLLVKGNEESLVKVNLEEGSGVRILNVDQPSSLEYVRITGGGSETNSSSLVAYKSHLRISNAIFEDAKGENALSMVNSRIILDNVSFQNILNDAVDIKYNTGEITNCYFFNCAEDGVDVTGAVMLVSNVKMDSIGNIGVNVKALAKVTCDNISIRNSRQGFSSEDESLIGGRNIQLEGLKLGFSAKNNKERFLGSAIEVNEVTFSRTEEKAKCGENSLLRINGVLIKPEEKKPEEPMP